MRERGGGAGRKEGSKRALMKERGKGGVLMNEEAKKGCW